MNTVGRAGALGGSIRCVVSVSMLTEGWDANTVTHVLGVRAEAVDLNLAHLEDTRMSTLLFHLTHRLLYTKWRNAGEERSCASSASSSASRASGSKPTGSARAARATSTR
jgi:hypothetical protein